MGLKRSIMSRVKDFDEILEDLINAGLAEDEIERYAELKEEKNNREKRADILRKEGAKVEENVQKEDKRIENLEKRIEKMEEKAGPFAKLRFSKVFFWSKDGKKYRNHKARIERAKERKKDEEKKLDAIIEKETKESKLISKVKKTMGEIAKKLRKIWRKEEDEQENSDGRINEIKRNLRKIWNGNEEKIEEEKDVRKKKKEDKENSKDKQNRKNTRKRMSENVVFGEETFLKRNIIERMQNMGENKYLKEFTPEELMTFIGYIAKQKDGEIETEELKKIREKSKDKNFSDVNSQVAKEALNILEEKITNLKENKKEENISKIDEYIYKIAEEYIKAEEKIKTEKKNAKKEEKEKQEKQE